MLMQVTAIIIGYLLGSISPSYFIGRYFYHIDIRLHGSGNAGTMNTIEILGKWPAVLTGLIDTTKGIIAIAIGYQLKVPEPIIYASGIAAVVGHIFPFYMHFKGGQGVATAVGLLLLSLVNIVRNGWLPGHSQLIIVTIVLSFVYIHPKGEIIGAIVLPFLLYEVFYHAPLAPLTVFFAIIISHILFVNFVNILKSGEFKLTEKTKTTIIWWRFFLRPVAIIFPIFYFIFDKKTVLVIIGVVTIFFIMVDGVRLFHRRINVLIFKNIPRAFKEKEAGKFSSMTIFLVATFITFLLFQRTIACLAILFIIFGDLLGKFFGLQYGKVKIFNKTLEGSIAFFSACLMAGFIFSHYVNLPAFIWLIGALSATITELLPLGVDDNFSVPIVSASTMLVTTVS